MDTFRRLAWFITFRAKSSKVAGAYTNSEDVKEYSWLRDSCGNYWRVFNFSGTKRSLWRKFCSYLVVFILFHHFYWSLFAILWFLWFGLYERNEIVLTVSGWLVVTLWKYFAKQLYWK